MFKKLFIGILALAVMACAGLEVKERVFNGKLDTEIYVTDLDEKTYLTDFTDQDWPWIAGMEKNVQTNSMPDFELLKVWLYMIDPGEYGADAIGLLADLDGDGVADDSMYCMIKHGYATKTMDECIADGAFSQCMRMPPDGFVTALDKELAK